LTDGHEDVRLDTEPTSPQQRWVLEYLITAHDESALKKKREKLRDDLKQWIIDNCDPDENGSYIYYFDKSVFLNNIEVKGLIAQRRTSEFVNEDRAFIIADKYNVREQVTYEVTTEELDLDAMYRLNQQGVISDEDIDSVLELHESFALTKLT